MFVLKEIHELFPDKEGFANSIGKLVKKNQGGEKSVTVRGFILSCYGTHLLLTEKF